MIRFLALVLSLLSVAWPSSARACSCRLAFEVVTVVDRVSGLEPVDEVPVVAIDRPVILSVDDLVETLEFYRGDELLAYEYERIVDDSLCGGDLLAVKLLSPVEVGDELSFVSPEVAELAATYEEPPEWSLPRRLRLGPAQEAEDSDVSVSVLWTRSWPYEFSGAGCAANELSPHTGYGEGRVFASSGSDVEYYVSARVLLPNAQPYQHTGLSRFDVHYNDDREVQKAEGTSATVHVPLTDPSETPECIQVTVYDHRFTPIFDQEMCPEEPVLGDAHAWATFSASLVALPDFPEERDEVSVWGGGCSLARGHTKDPWWAMLAVILLWKRRAALASRSREKAERDVCDF